MQLRAAQGSSYHLPQSDSKSRSSYSRLPWTQHHTCRLAATLAARQHVQSTQQAISVIILWSGRCCCQSLVSHLHQPDAAHDYATLQTSQQHLPWKHTGLSYKIVHECLVMGQKINATRQVLCNCERYPGIRLGQRLCERQGPQWIVHSC